MVSSIMLQQQQQQQQQQCTSKQGHKVRVHRHQLLLQLQYAKLLQSVWPEGVMINKQWLIIYSI